MGFVEKVKNVISKLRAAGKTEKEVSEIIEQAAEAATVLKKTESPEHPEKIKAAGGENLQDALLKVGISAKEALTAFESIGKEGRGSRDFRAGTAKVFCGGENGGSKGACIADGGGKHAGEKNDCPDFYGRDFSGENGAARSGRKAENDFYAGSTFCGAGEAENDSDCGRNRACRKSGGCRRSGRAAAGSTEKGTGAGKGCGD